MITEDYVSYEVAKLLKEKGFDELCRELYSEDGILLHRGGYTRNSTLDNNKICRPTHQMALKWLREKYSIFIEINLVFMPNTHYNVCALDFKDLHNIQWYDDVPSCTIYEEAVEAALKYTLENLI